MAYEIGTASGHYDLLDKLRTFLETTLPYTDRWLAKSYLSGSITFSSITRSGTTATVTTSSPHMLVTGDYVTVSGASDSLYNGDFAITYLSATSFAYIMIGTPAASPASGATVTRNNRQVIWSAPGLSGNSPITSIIHSGTTATATFPSAHGLVTGATVIIKGASDSLYNGTFTVTVTSSTVFTYTMGSTPSADASGTLYMQQENIYVGLATYQLTSADYYNFRIRGFTGYVSSNTFDTQPGADQSPNSGIPLWNNSIPYWFVGNGQRIIVVAKIGTNYNSFYLGKILPYASPSQYPYPLAVCGMLTTAATTRYDDTNYISWFKGNRINCGLRFLDGTYRNPECLAFTQEQIFRNTNSNNTTATGYYGLHPIILSDINIPVTGNTNVYGEFDGLYQISGYNQAVENILTISSIDYIVFRDVYRTNHQDYFALRLS